MRKILVFLVLLTAGSLAAADARIEIHAEKVASYKIPRTIFGTFLEPIGHSIYPGLWAQVLENPSFEDNLWSAVAIGRMLQQEPALSNSSKLGLPLPWEPLDAKQGSRYEPRWGDAANSFRSLMIMALPGKQTGVRQAVWLPVHRILLYTGSLYARHLSGPAELEISLRQRNHPETVFARSAVTLASGGWKRYEFSMSLRPGQVQPLDAVDFVIAARDEGRVLVDQAFLVPADSVKGMDPEMVAMTRNLDTPVIRYGGNFTSGYHFRDGIGPIDKRVTMLNQSWGMPEYNHFGTDEFLDYCRLVGAEPQIALNLGSGTPEEAADWVRYVNQRWGSGGLLWELGNELWGNFQIGFPTLERIAERTRRFSEAVRRVDPKARLIATGADPDHFHDWNAAQLTLPPGTFGFLSTHFVVGAGTVKRTDADPDFIARSAFALPVGLERRLREMKGQIDADAQARGRVGIAFTEWLFHGGRGNSPYFANMGGAVMTAGFLSTLMRVADFTPISDMTGIIEFGGIWKKRGRVYGVPAYWAFQMYSKAHATRPVAVENSSETYDIAQGNTRIPEIPGVPYLDMFAALNDAGDRLTLFSVNRDPAHDRPARIHITGFRAQSDADVTTLQAAGISEANSEEHPDQIRPVKKSLSVNGDELNYTFPRAGVVVITLKR